MNQLSFWLGFFAGSFSLTIILLIWLRSVRLTSTAEESKKHMATTERLLTERNDIDAEILSELRRIANAAESQPA